MANVTQTHPLNTTRFALLLLALVAVSFPDVLFFGNSFVFRDFGGFCYPLAYHHRQSFWQGEVPLWNPLSNCGIPFLAQWNTLVFYPLSAIYLLLPMPWSASFYCLVHLFIGGVGMFRLARHWTGNPLAAGFAGITYAFSGLVLNSLMWMGNIAGLGWAPWVLLTVGVACQTGGRRFLIAAGIGATQMLAGPPEIVLFTWILASGLWFLGLIEDPKDRRRRFWRFLGIVTSISLLASIMLLPFFDFMIHGERDYEYFHRGIPKWGALNLLVPLFRMQETAQGAFMQPNQIWTSSYYVGIGALALSVLALLVRVRCKRLWLMVALWIFGLFYGTGANGPFYWWLVDVVPGLETIHFPVKGIILITLTTPLIAALSLDALHKSIGEKQRLLLLAGIWLVFVAIIIGTLHYARGHPYPAENAKLVQQSGITRIILLTVIAGILVALPRFVQPRLQLVATGALLAALWIDGLTAVPRINPTVNPSVFAPNIAAAQFNPVPTHGESRISLSRQAGEIFYRANIKDPGQDYLGKRAVLLANCNLLDNVPKVGGFFSIYLPGQLAVIKDLFYVEPPEFPHGLADFLSVSHINSATNVFDWEKRPTFLPMATIGQKPLFMTSREARTFMKSKEFDPRQVVCLLREAQEFVTATNNAAGRIIKSHFTAHRIEIETEVTEPALLVLSHSFYHRWKGYIDEKPATILRANRSFQALDLPAGTRRVKLVYEDTMFRTGASLTLMTLTVGIFMWFRLRRARVQ